MSSSGGGSGDVYAVEKLLKSKMIGRRLHYLVKWQGYGHQSNTWEPETNVLDRRLIAEFEATQKKMKAAKRSSGDGGGGGSAAAAVTIGSGSAKNKDVSPQDQKKTRLEKPSSTTTTTGQRRSTTASASASKGPSARQGDTSDEDDEDDDEDDDEEEDDEDERPEADDDGDDDGNEDGLDEEAPSDEADDNSRAVVASSSSDQNAATRYRRPTTTTTRRSTASGRSAAANATPPQPELRRSSRAARPTAPLLDDNDDDDAVAAQLLELERSPTIRKPTGEKPGRKPAVTAAKKPIDMAPSSSSSLPETKKPPAEDETEGRNLKSSSPAEPRKSGGGAGQKVQPQQPQSLQKSTAGLRAPEKVEQQEVQQQTQRKDVLDFGGGRSYVLGELSPIVTTDGAGASSTGDHQDASPKWAFLVGATGQHPATQQQNQQHRHQLQLIEPEPADVIERIKREIRAEANLFSTACCDDAPSSSTSDGTDGGRPQFVYREHVSLTDVSFDGVTITIAEH